MAGGYPQQGYPQQGPNPYGQPGGYARLKPHRGGLLLGLSLGGWILGCFPLPFVAYFMAKGDLAEINAGVMDPSGKDMTNAAYWISIVYMVIFGLSMLIFLGVFAVALLAVGAESVTV